MKNQKDFRVIKSVLKFILIIFIFFMCVVFVIGSALAIYIDNYVEKKIDDSLFGVIGSGSESELYYYERDEKTQKPVAKRLENEVLYSGYRTVYVDYEELPSNLIDAFVSIEDKRFYSHNGVDWKRTASAALNYFLKFSNSYGGSTITQQLIKNITNKDDYSFQRKIQEIFWALDLETKMDKQEILELYMNVINLSQGCYGVGAAADYYFSKNISELTLNECACIAAITNNPSYYDPMRNPENNLKRKDLILLQMYEQGYITEAEYAENKGISVKLNVNSKYSSSEINSWYIDMVVEDIINDLIVQKGYSRTVANLLIYTGGLKIYTAIDPQIQSIVENYYSRTSNFYGAGTPDNLQSSMIVIDPENGDILAVAGAIGKKGANRIQNYATQTLRPPGSVIKPLSVYAPALESGKINYASVYDDVPVNFGEYNLDESKGHIVAPVAWPKNSSGTYRGLTNINYAIEHSINTVTVRVLEDIGLENSFNFLYDKLGLKSLIRSGEDNNGAYITDMDVAALALGQLNYGLTVREITAAYSIFANSGIYNGSRSYYKVTDSDGSILLENEYNGRIVISEENASIMSMMLENVVKNGTAKTIDLKDSVACAGKTGTTQNNYDRWYVGYTPDYIAGVWYGYEYPKTLYGSNICLNIWDDIVGEIYKRKPNKEESRNFDYSDNVIECVYCVDSGLLLSEACTRDARGSRAEIGYFVKGSEPKSYCRTHVPVMYDKTFGGVALDGMCKNTDYVGMITVKRSFPMQVYISDAQYVYRDIGEGILPETASSLPFFNNILQSGEYCGISNTDEQYNRLCRAHFKYYDWLERKNRGI